jgi:hypothetical protein
MDTDSEGLIRQGEQFAGTEIGLKNDAFGLDHENTKHTK